MVRVGQLKVKIMGLLFLNRFGLTLSLNREHILSVKLYEELPECIVQDMV